MPRTMCEDCENFITDPETDEEYCAIDLDEDEMAEFTGRCRSRCPYYRPGDEYRLVQKQN